MRMSLKRGGFSVFSLLFLLALLLFLGAIFSFSFGRSAPRAPEKAKIEELRRDEIRREAIERERQAEQQRREAERREAEARRRAEEALRRLEELKQKKDKN